MKKILLAIFAMLIPAMFGGTAAHAQATRTWVSGVGDDVNPCSRTAPCKTFAGAISKTAAGGEINCLDPGGFGAVTINKSLTIDCHYTEGGALAGGNGITINDSLSATPGTAVVYLRGLDIFGVNPPTNGVRFVSGAELHIQQSVIRRFNAAGSFGVSFQPSGASRLFITDTTIADNGNGATGGGVLIQPTGAGGSARFALRNIRIVNNAAVGLQTNTTGATSPTGVAGVIEDSLISGNGNGIHVLVPAGSPGTTLTVVNNVVAVNTATGILGDGASATIRVSNTTITGNVTGVNRANGSTMNTYGDNRNKGNSSSEGTFTLPALNKD